MQRSFPTTHKQQTAGQCSRYAAARCLPCLIASMLLLSLVGCAQLLRPAVVAPPNPTVVAEITEAPLTPTSSPAPTETATPAPTRTATSTLAPSVTATATPTVASTATHTSALASETSTALAGGPYVTPTLIVVRATSTLPALDQAARTKRFDEVWQKIHNHYLYSDFQGLDWQALGDEYRPQALAAPSSEAFYHILSTMVAMLADGHSRFISPQEAQSEQSVIDGTEAYVGIGVSIAPYEPIGIVDTVFDGSPARAAGLRRRDRILAVDGEPFAGDDRSLRGPEGTSIRLSVLSPGEQPREVVVERREVAAKRQVTAYRIGDTDIAYVLIQSFFPEDTGAQIHSALDQQLATGPIDGLIVDIRGNGGGWRHVLEDALANFVTGRVGEFYSQDKSTPLEIMPNALYERLANTPIVVLVDGYSQSYSEVFAAVIQATERGVVVGSATVGNTESIYAYDFEDKSRLWVAQEGFRLPSGISLEGRGVLPDVIMDVNWALYSEADDPHILKALDLLRQAPRPVN